MSNTATNLDAALFCTAMKRARDLSVGDSLDISPHIEVIAHIETTGNTVRGYFHTGRTFRYAAATMVRVQELV